MTDSFTVQSIGKVIHKEEKHFIQMDKKVRAALKQVKQFSHINVLWWSSEFSSDAYRQILEMELPYAPGTQGGVFSTRSPMRPNPIMVTTCKMLNVNMEEGLIEVNNIDAYDGTPILDLKVYIPCCDRVEKPRVASWAEEWGEWYPEAGMEVEDYG